MTIPANRQTNIDPMITQLVMPSSSQFDPVQPQFAFYVRSKNISFKFHLLTHAQPFASSSILSCVKFIQQSLLVSYGKQSRLERQMETLIFLSATPLEVCSPLQINVKQIIHKLMGQEYCMRIFNSSTYFYSQFNQQLNYSKYRSQHLSPFPNLKTRDYIHERFRFFFFFLYFIYFSY